MFQKNDFIKWSSTDSEGPFYYIGRVEACYDGKVQFVINGGSLAIVPEDDGKFEIAQKPDNWAEESAKGMTEDGEVKITPDPIVRTKKSRKKGETKVDLVVKLLQGGEKLSRKDAIARIVEAGISTSAGASTAFNSAKKVLGW